MGKKRSPAPTEYVPRGNDFGADRPPTPGYGTAPNANGPAVREPQAQEPYANGSAGTGPRGGGRERWLLRNWPLRYKMSAVLLVPTLAAIGVGGIRVYDGLMTAHQLDNLVQEVDLTERASDVVQALQTERDNAVVVTFNGGSGALDSYKAKTAQIDAAVRRFEALQSDSAGFSPMVRNAYSSATTRLNSLGAVRNTVQQGFTEPAALTVYDSIISSVQDVNRATATAAANTEVNRTAQAAEAISIAKEQLAQERSLLLGAAIHGSFIGDQVDEMRAADAQFNAALMQFRSVASPEQQLSYAALVASPDVDQTARAKEAAVIAAETGKPLSVDPNTWATQSTNTIDLVWQVEQQLQVQFRDVVSQNANAARWTAIRDGALIIAFLLLAIGFATYIARSMLRPLRILQYGALDIAQKDLPEAIRKVNDNPGDLASVQVPQVPVHTSEEIGQVARSFDAVHQEALRLASEQALLRNNVNDLFVNLARRSQTLVQRQLSLIDRLEQDEQDPDQLGSLFELDHLATRMRRNNENLLILGGTDLTRRMMRPVPLAEVIGAAVSEVEQYARVSVADSPELAVQGRVVNDFVHLVAELLENATAFSNPDTEVSVRTAYRKQELVLEIRDRGVGIDAKDLGEINDRLMRPPEIDVAVSRRMGLYVVGQLARRHNIRVELQNNDDLEGGVTASVHLAGEYVAQITPSGPIPMPDVPRGYDEARDAVTDSGTHIGLAAAFRRDTFADRGTPEPTTAAPQPSGGPVGEGAEAGWEMDQASAGAGEEATEFSVQPSQYSVRVGSGEPVGATDVPSWPDTGTHYPQGGPDSPLATFGFGNVLAGSEPSQESSGVNGTSDYWAADSGSPQDLFHSPYESEKTAQFEALSGVEWNAQYTAEQDPAAMDQSAGQPLGGENESAIGSLGHSLPAEAGREMDDAPTQRLPIYEAVLSQWFRESDDDPASSRRNPLGSPDVTAGPSAPESGTERSDTALSAFEFAGAPDNGVSGGPANQPHRDFAAALEPDSSDPGRDDRRRDDSDGLDSGGIDNSGGRYNAAAPYDPGWGYADDGWQAAEAVLRQSTQTQDTTRAGLPKRVPRTNLVPGSPMARPQPAGPGKPARVRSAEAVRGRMSNFQQGIRRGRHAKDEPAEEVPLDSEPS